MCFPAGWFLGLVLACGGAYADSTGPGEAAPLLEGVTPYQVGGSIPGSIVLVGDAAVPLLVATERESAVAVVGAVGPFGKGRFVAFGHEALVSADGFKQAGGERLLTNLLASRAVDRPVAVPEARLRDALEAAGIDVVGVGNDWADHLDDYGAILVSPTRITGDNAATIIEWVRGGGTLIGGMPGWGYLSRRPDHTLGDDLVAQRVFAHGGLLFGLGHHGGEVTPAVGSASAGAMFRVDKVLDVAEQMLAGEKVELSVEDGRLFARQLSAVGSILPPTLLREREQLSAITAGVARMPVPVPTPARPLTERDHPLQRLALRQEANRRRNLPAEQVEAHPAADTFPGAVPADAERVSRTITLDASVPDWHGTGLYAAPGEVVEVVVPASATTLGLRVQIGNCIGRNYHLSRWERHPDLLTTLPIETTTTRIASAFGGPVYLLAPDDADAPQVEVNISHAVPMPRFVLGETDPAEWCEAIRHAPGPWADLESPHVILSLPGRYIRQLEDPTELMRWWDAVGKLQGELSQRPHAGQRRRAERIVLDEQIGYGYMHAGYPIMTGPDVREQFVDLARLKREGNWGIYHEIGHNHQWPAWTYEGTTEVTVNIFSLYSYERLQPGHAGHPEMAARDVKMAQMWDKHGPPDNWKRDVFFALYMFADLRDEYGWEAFRGFFERYEKMPPAYLPTDDPAKRDGWLVNFSEVVGQNVAPLMDSYGVTTSDAARARVSHLPDMDLSPVRDRAARGRAQVEAEE